MIPIEPSIIVTGDSSEARLEAHVHATGTSHLGWRLSVVTHGHGNNSRIVQSGVTDGEDRNAVATVRVNSSGEARLEVFLDGKEVAQTVRTFDAPTPR